MLDQEIVDGFKDETLALISELNEVVENLESSTTNFPVEDMQKFAQIIDRVMGTAQTLLQMEPGHKGLERISAIAAMCKGLGYKAAEIKLNALVPVFAGFWADTLEALQELVTLIDDPAATEQASKNFSQLIQKRLEWLVNKVKTLAPDKSEKLSQINVDALLKSFS